MEIMNDEQVFGANIKKVLKVFVGSAQSSQPELVPCCFFGRTVRRSKRVQNRESGIWNLKSEIWNLESGI